VTKNKVNVPVEYIKAIGKNAIVASSNSSQQASLAWQLTLDLISFRSILNVSFKPKTPVLSMPLHTWLYFMQAPPGKHIPTMAFSSQSGLPSNEAARCDRIGVDQNSDIGVGPVFLFLLGGSQVLDDFHIRNAVFEGVEVHYSGGQTMLENDIFINCTFVMDNTSPARKLGQELIASTNINFKNT
jgi:hypothetical protein